MVPSVCTWEGHFGALRRVHNTVESRKHNRGEGEVRIMTCEREIHIVVVRQECDTSVGHLYKCALRVVERCVLSAAPGQPQKGIRHIMIP